MDAGQKDADLLEDVVLFGGPRESSMIALSAFLACATNRKPICVALEEGGLMVVTNTDLAPVNPS